MTLFVCICSMASGCMQVRGDREQLLQQAREKGTVEVKDAIRRTLKGGKIHLISGVLWTIEAPTGKHVAGAALLRVLQQG